MDNNKSKTPMIVISGTNASGKSSLGIELAKKYNGEIISADSRQIFKNFDLCCGKVTIRLLVLSSRKRQKEDSSKNLRD